jgi:hypothetical protein
MHCVTAEGLNIDYDPDPEAGLSLLREALRGEDGAMAELVARETRVVERLGSRPVSTGVSPKSSYHPDLVLRV